MEWGTLLGALAVFSAAVLPWVGAGVESWDGHKILLSVRALLERHEVLLSRLPGHPTSDIYLFGGIGWLVEHVLRRPFGSEAFLIVCWLAALGTGLIFHQWLIRSGVRGVAAGLATGCLLFSPQFLAQTIDGEEFVLGLGLLFAAMVILPLGGQVSRSRFLVSAVCFALSTGARPELLVAGVIFYALYLTHLPGVGLKTWVEVSAMVILAMVAVWSPILITHGANALVLERADAADTALVWGYKLMFVCFGFPTGVALFATAAWCAVGLFRCRSFGWEVKWQGALCVMIPAAYILMFAILPHKPAYVLVCVPFLLWLVARARRGVFVGVALLTAANLWAGISLFRDRVLTSPHLAPGWYHLATEGKPAARVPYVRGLTAIPAPEKSAIVADVWSWNYEYYIRHGILAAHPVRPVARVLAYAMNRRSGCVLVPREYAEVPELLRRLHDDGYEIIMDRLLWRTLYARYVVTLVPRDRVSIAGTPVKLVTIAQPQ